VFKNRFWRRVFCPKIQEVKGDWKKLQNEQFHDLYSSPKIIWVIKQKRIKWVGHVAHTGQEKNACWFLVGKAEGEGPL
jgi:hypothetical protein